MATINLGFDTVPTGTREPSVPVNDTFDKVDKCLAATVTHEFTLDANYQLLEADYLTSALIFTDSPVTLTAGRDVIFPTHFPMMYVKNSTAQTLTMKKSGQSGVTVTAGNAAIVASGSTDVVKVDGSAALVTSVNGDTGAVIVPVPIGIACSDETTALTTGTAKVTFRMPYAMTLTGVRATLSTAQASGSIFTVDINESGTTILSTKLTIDNTEKTSTTAATPPVISDSSLADDAEMTVDIDQIGDGTAKGLKVWLIGYPA